MKNKQIRKQRRQALILILFGGLLLIVAAFLFGRQNAAPQTAADPQVPYPDVARISLVEARSRFDSGQVIMLDVRSRSDFEDAHIPGAVSIPLSDLAARFQELPIGAEILTYCT